MTGQHFFADINPDAPCPDCGFPAWSHDPGLAVLHGRTMTEPSEARREVEALPTWDKRSVPGGLHVNRSAVLAILDRSAHAGSGAQRLARRIVEVGVFDIPIGRWSKPYDAGPEVAASRLALEILAGGARFVPAKPEEGDGVSATGDG